ncbi:MAG: hypothetical protein SGJ09_05580 [Phycisphaerae bacterium]|nr:hypothetical protein [Phycisphaerae bacterium]
MPTTPEENLEKPPTEIRSTALREDASRLEDPDDLFPPPLEPRGDRHGELLPAHIATLSATKRVWLIVAGIVLIIVGIIGWILPVVTGVPFWVAGLICLSRASDRCRRLVNFGDRRLPGKVRTALRWTRDKTGLHKHATSPTSSEPSLQAPSTDKASSDGQRTP